MEAQKLETQKLEAKQLEKLRETEEKTQQFILNQKRMEMKTEKAIRIATEERLTAQARFEHEINLLNLRSQSESKSPPMPRKVRMSDPISNIDPPT